MNTSLLGRYSRIDALGSRAAAHALIQRLRRSSDGLARFFDVRIDILITVWIALVVLAGFAKVLFAPIPPRGLSEAFGLLLPYLLVALAPIAGYRIAADSFPRGLLSAQPTISLARWFGRWRALDVVEARANPLFGPAGFMASLLLGMMLNVPVRTFEYLTAVPAISQTAPGWAQLLFHAMTIDVLVMNFFYMVCFVMALRSVPLFPRMLLFAWLLDIVIQLGIARQLAAAPQLPGDVAEPLLALLKGNIHKVLISAALWLPYILLSERVNVTYRCRASELAAGR